MMAQDQRSLGKALWDMMAVCSVGMPILSVFLALAGVDVFISS